MLTIEDIVSNMCEGQFADRHKNAATKSKLPPQLWFVDSVLQRNVCPLGHKTQRRDLFLTALYSFYRGYWCSIPEIIWTQLYKFWEGVHQRAAETSPEAGDCHSHFSSHICSGSKASKVLRMMGLSLSIRSLAGFSGIRVIHTCLEGIGPEPQMSQR
jgi:hypothetical protein